MLSFSLLPVTALALISSTLAADTCNGHAELCSRQYSNVTFIGAHDSYAVGDGLADNQDKDVTAQLNDGIRTLQLQAHNASDGVHLCHTSCSLQDGGLLSDYFGKVVSWVSSNPNDVVTIVLTNPENLPVSTYSSILTSSGIDQYMYQPSSSAIGLSDWPTLGELIDQKKTVVAFLDYQANFDTEPRLIDEFSNMWEDAYNVVDASFGCSVNRTSGQPSAQMYLINHYLDSSYALGGTQFWIPNKDQLNVTNSESGDGSIGFHVGNCVSLWGRNPNHILLDFYDAASNAPFNLAASLNGVSAPTNTVTAGSGATASVTSGGTAKVSSSSLNSAAVISLDLKKGLYVGLSVVGALVFGIGRTVL
ncbi:uncharacterized protein I303_108547 [Kwoniella dejecticola CBS 10117]|uniref:PLC-like phosphodiesterase n=1 Tax=Kwoniella dejecticola CBS 10117 TaxID=1296121 RepID=A0A1A5ZX36_9TREE|nr:uncharacterized protein I303_07129 [Kwoniella dejecticola CBS 10117]OBR82370.1 hypothetical protein I303_07129 [Kwoniella dejecticola CBS 10117]